MSSSTVERRTHVRFPHRFEIEGPETGDGAIARMVASDLSLGGLHCSSTHDFPEMTRLAVRLQLPGPAAAVPVDVEAVVVRRRAVASSTGNGRFELALYFTAMSDAARDAIERFLASNAGR